MRRGKMSEAASNLGGQRDNEPGYRCTCGGKKRAQPQPNRSPARIACGCLVEAGETPAVRFIYIRRETRGTHHFGLLILLKEMPELCCLQENHSILVSLDSK